MRDVLNCIYKYIKATESEKFIVHWKKLADSLLDGVKEGYKAKEPAIVKLVEGIVNKVKQFETKDKELNIVTNSIFIHGSKSQVEFRYYGKETQRELGDIIFILSIVYNGKKYFEKTTINQVKKSNKASWNLTNDSAKEQLYLLSRFPTFRGAKNSLIPAKDYNLQNYSGCLGTHGLLYYPGDFALISSKQLEFILSGRNTLKLTDLLLYPVHSNMHNCFPCYYTDYEECLYTLRKFFHLHLKYPTYYPIICNLSILGNSCISYNAYDFSDKYLRGLIGELTYARELPYNRFAFQFLQDLLEAIKKKAKRENLREILSFIDHFYSYQYSDYNGGKEDEIFGDFSHNVGGIAIIHTTINLGEGG